MAFSDRVDEATKGVATANDVRADLRTAFTTFQTDVATVLTTYGLNDKDKLAVDDKLIDLARYLEAALR